jgi:hypothetical protein
MDDEDIGESRLRQEGQGMERAQTHAIALVQGMKNG